MALRFTGVHRSSMGSKIMVSFYAQFDTSYPTGGELLLPASIGLTQIEQMDAIGVYDYGFKYDYANHKLKAYTFGGGGGSGTTDPASGGTPAGTVSAPTFSGSFMPGHNHVAYTGGGTTSSVIKILEVTGPTGSFFGGDVITGVSTGNTATVQSWNPGNQTIILNSVGETGPFAQGETINAVPGGSSATVVQPILVSFNANFALNPSGFPLAVTGNSGTMPLRIVSQSAYVATGTFRWSPSLQLIETNYGDSVTNIEVFGYTGDISSQSAGIPAGDISQPTFTGSPLASHTHAFSTGGGGGAGGEVSNGSDLRTVVVQLQAVGL